MASLSRLKHSTSESQGSPYSNDCPDVCLRAGEVSRDKVVTKDQLPGHAFPGLPECCGPVCPCVNDGESTGLPNSNSSQAETHGCLGMVRTAHPASGAGVLTVLPG